MPSSLLHPRHFFSSEQPMSYNFFLHATSFHDHLPLRRLPVHTSFVFLRSTAWIGSNHTPSFSSSCSCFAAHFFQLDHPGLFQKHLLNVLRAGHSHVHHHLPFEQQGVPMRPLDAQVTGLAHDGSCRSSHLPPCLYIKDLLPPCLLLFFFTMFPTRPLAPERAWPRWRILPQLPTVHFHDK